MSENLERIVEFTPAFDKRHRDPSKNYGIHGVELRMVLKGEAGAVQFVLYTNWQLPHVTRELDAKRGSHTLCHPMPADLGYHSPSPRWDDQTAQPDCPYLDGKPCYYDGSGLNAERIYGVLLREGSDGVWRELREYYDELFAESAVLVSPEKIEG